MEGSKQMTGGMTATFGYAYTKGGLLDVLTLPTKRKIKSSYDGAGRPITAKSVDDMGATLREYAKASTYAAHGGRTSLTLGNNLVETTAFNARLQPTQMQLGSLWTLSNDYGVGSNNGNVEFQQLTVPGAPTKLTSYKYL